MTKLPIRTTSVLSALLLSIGAAAWQGEQKSELAGRVEKLEAELAGVQAYLQKQAAASESFEKALASVEAKGFTAGINGDSRKEFLAALRSDLKARREKVPGTPAPKAEEPTGRRRRR